MIRVTDQHLNTLKAEAGAAFPLECCGLLAGTVDGKVISVTRTVPSPNVSTHSGRDHFEVDAKVRFDLMRDLDESKLEQIVGHYHSHPNHSGEPSMTDLDMAFEPEMIWLIIPLQSKAKVDDIGAFRLDRELRTIESIDLEIISGPAGE